MIVIVIWEYGVKGSYIMVVGRLYVVKGCVFKDGGIVGVVYVGVVLDINIDILYDVSWVY